MTLVKTLLEAVLSPAGIITTLLASGIFASMFRRRSRLGPRLILAGSALWMLIVFTPVAEVVVATLERPYPALLVPADSPGTSAVVVLAGYAEERPSLPVTSRLSGETVIRLAEGIRLHRLLPGSRLVLSGGVLRTGAPPVADAMAAFCKELGVPQNDIVVEGRSRSTYENFVELKKILGEAPFILVTTASHLRRSMAVAHKLGMDPQPAPAAIWAAQHYPAGTSWTGWAGRLLKGMARPSVDRLDHLQSAFHEYVGYLWYWILGRL